MSLFAPNTVISSAEAVARIAHIGRAALIRGGQPARRQIYDGPQSEDLAFMPCDVSDRDIRRGGAEYSPRIFGTLEDGSKACVMFANGRPYFHVRASAAIGEAELRPTTEEQAIARVESRARELGLSDIGVLLTCDRLYPMHGFTTEKEFYVRATFGTLESRKAWIEAFHKLDPTCTAHDDTTGSCPYFNILAREYKFRTAGWNLLGARSARVIRGNTEEAARRYGLHGVDWLVVLDIEDYRPAREEDELSGRCPKRDLLLVESWDIETDFESPNGEIPRPGNDFNIPTISLVYSAHWCPQRPMLSLVLSVYPGVGNDSAATVLCASERELLIVRMAIAAIMRPDIRIAFNGANFDWPLFRAKLAAADLGADAEWAFGCQSDGRYVPADDARRFGFVNKALGEDRRAPSRPRSSDDALRYAFRRQNIKITATDDHICECVAQWSGTLDIDIQPAIRKLFPREEVRFAASLNTYLRKCDLPSKEDVYFRRMMKIYKRAAAAKAWPACPGNDACAVCRADIPEVDYDVANRDAPMRDWRYVVPSVRGGHEARLRASLDNIGLINKYCAVDSIRPLQLIVKLSIMFDKFELANLTYTCLADAFFRADGMRVQNYTASFANLFSMAISCANTDRADATKEHYPGALVLPPMTGVHNRRPIAAQDFASLYPSLMRTYNISPDTIVSSEQQAADLKARGYELHEIGPFAYEVGLEKGAAGNEQRTGHGWCVRHGGIVDPRKEGSPTIAGYDNPAPGRLVARYGRPGLPREHMGIFAYAVSNLFEARRPLKLAFVALSVLLESIPPSAGPETRVKVPDGLRANVPVDGEGMCAVGELAFARSCIDSKQKALKVLANTFYGQSGNFRSPAYSLLVAAGITCAGKQNLGLIADFVRRLGYTVIYGDTDSVYLQPPESVFAGSAGAADAMIRATMADMARLRDLIAAQLAADNNTTFLSTDYEEVGFPTVFCGKKKYYLRPHLKKVNFEAKPMIRGIDIVKQGQAPIVKMLGEAIIGESLDIANRRPIIDIVLEKVDRFYGSEIPVRQFVRFATYRPGKKNCASRFAERMEMDHKRRLEEGVDPAIAALYEPPTPGDKFEFVIVAKGVRRELTGAKVEQTVGDRMEYLRVFEHPASGLELDREHYMTSGLVGLFARFILSDARFQPKAGSFDLNDNDGYKAYDTYCLNAASEFLKRYCAAKRPAIGAGEISAARRMRGAYGAIRRAVVGAAGPIAVVNGSPATSLLMSERMRDLLEGRKFAALDEKDFMQIAAELGRMAEAKDPGEQVDIGVMADQLMRRRGPGEMAQLYAGEYFHDIIEKPIEAGIEGGRERLGFFARRLAAMYLRLNIPLTIERMARIAAEKKCAAKDPTGFIELSPADGELVRDIDRVVADLRGRYKRLREQRYIRDQIVVRGASGGHNGGRRMSSADREDWINNSPQVE